MNALYGLILCGGKSSRLGFPKYQIEKESMPLYKWWIKTMHTFCDETFISCQTSQIADIDYPFIIEDESKDSGPLEGIYNAFLFNCTANWLVVACDLVYAGGSDLDALLKNNRSDKTAVCFENPETGEPYPLLCIYNSRIFPTLKQEYQGELKSAKHLLMVSDALVLKPEDPKILKGINTIEELEDWKKT